MTPKGGGEFVSNRGWVEIGTLGSSKMKVAMFNINNATRSSSFKNPDEDKAQDMSDVSEFELALRTMRVAAHFATPWNMAYVALENFLIQKKFFEDELRFDSARAKTLCQFCDFVLNENSNHYRDGEGFLTTGELQAYWTSFIGARPQFKHATPAPTPSSAVRKSTAVAKAPVDRKRKYPFVDICHKWNTGFCSKAPGACFNFRGVALKHVCDWRDPTNQNAPPCGQNHTRVSSH